MGKQLLACSHGRKHAEHCHAKRAAATIASSNVNCSSDVTQLQLSRTASCCCHVHLSCIAHTTLTPLTTPLAQLVCSALQCTAYCLGHVQGPDSAVFGVLNTTRSPQFCACVAACPLSCCLSCCQRGLLCDPSACESNAF